MAELIQKKLQGEVEKYQQLQKGKGKGKGEGEVGAASPRPLTPSRDPNPKPFSGHASFPTPAAPPGLPAYLPPRFLLTRIVGLRGHVTFL